MLKNDFMKVQVQYANPCTIEQKDVEAFRQKLLEGGSKRDFAIVTLYTYTGIRRSECVNLKLEHVDLVAKEIYIVGKGDKYRTVYLNDKTVHAIREYLKVRSSDSPYLFVSRQSDRMAASRINQIFNQYSDSGGCIFMDCRVDASLSDRHSIIYGHHMKNGTMFSGLSKYKKQQYYEEHPSGLLITPECTYRIDFFAGYVAGTDEKAWNIGFQSDEEFEAWIKETKKKSWIESPLSPAVTDRVLTLSTCSYEFDNARFVLHGIIYKTIP